jgi:hypothetical protein
VRKSRTALILGFAALTPALRGVPQNAEAARLDFAREIDIRDTSAATVSLRTARGLLANTLFSLSPSEKLDIAGERIRLASSTTYKKKHPAPAHYRPNFVPQTANRVTKTCTVGTAAMVRGKQ